MRLFASGRVEIQHRFWSAWWGILGLSPGGDGSEPATAIDYSTSLPFSGSAGQAVYEHFEFRQPASLGGANRFQLYDHDEAGSAVHVALCALQRAGSSTDRRYGARGSAAGNEAAEA